MTLTEAIEAEQTTQRQLARDTGLPESTISNMTRGYKVGLSVAERVATALRYRVELDELTDPDSAGAMRAWHKRKLRRAAREEDR